MLGELCATTGWHRSRARTALRQALIPRVVRLRRPRPATYRPEVLETLRFRWTALGVPTGYRAAPALADLVLRQRRFAELEFSDEQAALLATMAAATIDRRLAPPGSDAAARAQPPQARLAAQGRHRDPDWGQRDDAVPGLVEIDLVGHEAATRGGG